MPRPFQKSPDSPNVQSDPAIELLVLTKAEAILLVSIMVITQAILHTWAFAN